jgi:hypothetical protein
MALDLIVRPFQLPDIAPARRVIPQGQPNPPNAVLNLGATVAPQGNVLSDPFFQSVVFMFQHVGPLEIPSIGPGKFYISGVGGGKSISGSTSLSFESYMTKQVIEQEQEQ